MKVINPANATVIKTLDTTSSADIKSMHADLRHGAACWRKQPIAERIRMIEVFKHLLQERIETLADDLSQEVGKPVAQSINEIKGACHRIQYFINHSEQTLEDEVQYQDNTVQEVLRYEPLGVICNISAWNYPYLVGVNVIVPALIAGNCVCYKPSEFALMTGLNIQALLYEAGIPTDVFKTVIGGPDAGQQLLELDFDGYFFTGSYRTGQAIAERVAPKLVPVGLELGGKDPAYVRADVTDIKAVAEALVEGAFYNNGQSCCAVERIYVDAKIAEAFTEHFVRATQALEPIPVTREAQLEVLRQQVDDAVKQGASLECGGARVEQPGYYFQPTVLTQVDHRMALMREESFGPIIGIQTVADDEEAIGLMNDTDYGLTAAIYTDDDATFDALAPRLEAGTVYRNCCDRVSPHLPWSGRKRSGIGSTLSYLGIQAFVQPKAYHLK